MPLPNGVDPTGAIEKVCPSAAWLGNRGEIHDAERRIVRGWKIKAWVTCQLSFKGWSRKPLMQPGSYTELFFLDEATALSAGHRPCGMCRKREYVSFKSLWLAANGYQRDLGIADVDKTLHAERNSRGGSGDWVRAADSLPPGVIVEFDGAPHLWNGRSLRRWTATGYGPDIKLCELPPRLQLLTPPSVVNAIQAGYQVQMHPTALA
ncbi:conserved hypothetical protein [Paraburkholderia atlantica]|uniref:Ada DNA repair metal-binding domain-containing protein n=1 Tax=Paraburkholderia atlantica TaxID=2654982 RepID=D5WBJ7_PARAM|nr:conserved hypothetical protein [Paraburkholderia atlantica]